MKRNLGVKLTSALLLGMVAATACTQTYSQAPLGTPTLIPTGLFVSPFPSGQDPLKIVADLGTQTAAAKTAQAGGGTSNATSNALSIATVGTPGTAAAATTAAPATVMPNSTLTTQATALAPTFTGSRPSSYTLQEGEFIYCVARRFDINPADLLSINNLSNADTIYPGLTLTIPQSGSFPGARSLLSHPDTYTVDGNGDNTIYAVACKYGDVYPEAIANANNLSLSTTLDVGQTLKIP